MKFFLFLALFLHPFILAQSIKPRTLLLAQTEEDPISKIESDDFEDEDFDSIDDDEEEDEDDEAEDEEDDDEDESEDEEGEVADEDFADFNSIETEYIDDGDLEKELIQEDVPKAPKQPKKKRQKKQATPEEDKVPEEAEEISPDSPSEDELSLDSPSESESELSLDSPSESEDELSLDSPSESESDTGVFSEEESPEESSDADVNFVEEETEFEEDLNIINNIRYVAEQDVIYIDGSKVISHQSKRNLQNNQLIIEILEAKLVENLVNRPYILKDFRTKFGLITADQKEESLVRVVIQLKDEAPFPLVSADDTGQQLMIGFDEQTTSSSVFSSHKATKDTLPSKTLTELYFGDIEFSGSPISFHVIDAPIKQVLRFISEESGLNMVIDESVTGQVTLKLENIPWDQALYTTLKVKNLGYSREGNVITVSPLKSIEERTKKLKEIIEQQQPLVPLSTKAIPVIYGKIADIQDKVKDFLTKENEATGQEAGKIISHEESNTLIVIDTEENIQKIESLVKYLDKTPKQVIVEARIVEAEETLSRNFGFRWDLNGTMPVTLSPRGILETLKGTNGDYSANGEGQFSLNLNGIPVLGDIQASLNVAEREGYARLISSPKIVTISGKAASITRNSPIQIPDSETSAPGGQTQTVTKFKTEDVKISLDVTPTVTSADTIFLKVSIARSSPGSQASFKTSRNAKTEVLVKNGHTIVIGGIYQYDRNNSKEGLPFLSKIPFLNYIFGEKRMSTAKNELLVFLTPKIINVNE